MSHSLFPIFSFDVCCHSVNCDKALIRAFPPGLAAVVPMDGFHYYRRELDQFEDPVEAHRRRGAHWTFNADRFVSSLEAARASGVGSFPSFDHSVGDPVEADVHVTAAHEIVVVEGLYLLLDIEPWCRIRGLADLSVFVDCPVDQLQERLVRRHMDALGLSKEEAIDRAKNSDLVNAIEIVESKKNAHLIV